jgi:hypothetical protein
MLPLDVHEHHAAFYLGADVSHEQHCGINGLAHLNSLAV